MLEKIKSYQHHPLIRQLHDVRLISLLVFVGLILLVSWNGIKVIQTNYELEQKLVTLQGLNELQELENSNLRLRNEYFETDEFLELAARRQFGKGAPGEKLLIVPKHVAMSYTVQTAAVPAEPSTIAEPVKKSNLEAWLDFFFHRTSGQ